MNRRTFGISLLAIALCAVAKAQSTNETWVGIWHANVANKPSATLTLANDTGELGGTFVLDIVNGEGGQPRVIASEPHVLMNPKVTGDTLTFQVKTWRPDATKFLATFEVKLTTADKAAIHCLNCDTDAPVVELVKGP
jgi:hypothetical protein